MKNFVSSLLAVLVVTLISSHLSLASCAVNSSVCGIKPVPEIDPAMGTGALALLGGAVMVIRGRSRAKKK
jgi:hypothetical protein